MMTKEASKLAEALGHDFGRPELLATALTHRSFRNENPTAVEDNERLEFLGDATLGMFVASMVFQIHPEASEGELTRMRAELVCEEGLRAVAEGIGVGDALRLGKGEERSGGRTKARLLSSALEALIGAVLIDAGAETTRSVVEKLFRPRITDATAERDAKSQLQEIVQRDQNRAPTYRLLETSGPDHERSFRVAVLVGDQLLAEGSGSSKARAEQLAATVALAEMGGGEIERPS